MEEIGDIVTNYKKEYTDRKIAKCKELVENATSDAQREVYRGYLEFWTRHAKKDDIDEELKEPTKIIVESIKPIEVPKIDTLANIFEIEYAPKKAYYNRDGKTHKTKAFKEFLIKNE